MATPPASTAAASNNTTIYYLTTIGFISLLSAITVTTVFYLIFGLIGAIVTIVLYSVALLSIFGWKERIVQKICFPRYNNLSQRRKEEVDEMRVVAIKQLLEGVTLTLKKEHFLSQKKATATTTAAATTSGNLDSSLTSRVTSTTVDCCCASSASSMDHYHFNSSVSSLEQHHHYFTSCSLECCTEQDDGNDEEEEEEEEEDHCYQDDVELGYSPNDAHLDDDIMPSSCTENDVAVSVQLYDDEEQPTTADSSSSSSLMEVSESSSETTESTNDVCISCPGTSTMEVSKNCPILFRQPESSHLGDCPICCLPHPIARSKAVMNGCCGKLICESCHYSNEMQCQAECPFCRHPLPSSEEEARELLMKRVEANDVPSLVEVGYHHNNTGDFDAAFKYWAKAAELDDDAEAHFCLATMYQHGKGGVEKDPKKEIYHLEKAAIAGHPNARFNLGCTDQAAGRTDRAVKHFIIAANLGHDTSLKFLQKFYADGKVSKEDFAATLRAYQSTVEAAKSRQKKKKKETESATAAKVSKVAAETESDKEKTTSFSSSSTTVASESGETTKCTHVRIPTMEVSKNCPICLSAYEQGESICYSSSNSECTHVFHCDCIIRWFVEMGRQNKDIVIQHYGIKKKLDESSLLEYTLSCPCCRQPFVQPNEVLLRKGGEENEMKNGHVVVGKKMENEMTSKAAETENEDEESPV